MNGKAKPTGVTAIVVALAISLSACASGPPPLDPDPIPKQAPPVVEAVQVDRILKSLGETLAESQEANDPALLKRRVAGAALTMLTAESTVKAANAEAKTTVLGTGFVDGQIVAQQDNWPRSFIAVTQPIANQARFLYQLTQGEARANYKMVAWARMLPGSELPAAAQATVGSPVVKSDEATGLKMSPAAALASYAKAKDDPAGEEAANFNTALEDDKAKDTDPVRALWTATRKAYADAAGQMSGAVKVLSQPVDGSIMALRTADSGALVFGQVTSVLDVTVAPAPGQKATNDKGLVPLGAPAEFTQSMHIEYLQTVVLAIGPEGTDGPVRVIAVAQTTVKASGS
ncbi:MAG: hypothetical protein FWD29_00355 [Micrococcales bacterium]|nr:hypothetical protein [Micrococcales bacterium]